MDELLRQIVGYLRAMWQYRWWGMAAAWIVGIAAAAAVFMIPDRYESSARIYVDTQSMLKPLMSGLAIQPNVDQQVAMLSRTLISRPSRSSSRSASVERRPSKSARARPTRAA